MILGGIQTQAQGCIAQVLIARPKLCADRQQCSRQQMGIHITDACPKQPVVVDKGMNFLIACNQRAGQTAQRIQNDIPLT